MFAQVALPRDAMREGEIADEAVVTDAVARLRTEVGLKKATVRVGIASPRVVVRQVEMPVMSRDELAGALQFQAGELIPIPIEDAVLDFAILGTSQPDADGRRRRRADDAGVAGRSATKRRWPSSSPQSKPAVSRSARSTSCPLALTRALARPVPVPVAAGAGGVARRRRRSAPRASFRSAAA